MITNMMYRPSNVMENLPDSLQRLASVLWSTQTRVSFGEHAWEVPASLWMNILHMHSTG